MLAEFIVDGEVKRFRISWLSTGKSIYEMDIQLTDISENPTSKFEGKRIPYEKWRESIKNNKVKIIC